MVVGHWCRSACAALMLVVILAPAATAENARYMDAKFPQDRQGAAAIWDGRYAFVFGSTKPGALHVHRYEPCRDALVDTGSRLPGPRANPAVVFDGTHAYVFGGWDPTSRRLLDEVLRYDPRWNEIVTLKERMPVAGELMGAAWDGEYAYLFGGHVDAPAGMTDDVVRFNPRTGEFAFMGASLPAPTTSSAGASDGTNVYVFGGGRQYATGFQQTDAILRYDTARDEARDVEGSLPGGRSKAAAVWGDGPFFVFGGSGQGTQRQIVRYDASQDRATLGAASMPDITVLPSVVWDGTRAYVFGVRDSADGAENRIVEYDPSNPGHPANVPTVAQRPCPPASSPPPPRTGTPPQREGSSLPPQVGSGTPRARDGTEGDSTAGLQVGAILAAVAAAMAMRRRR